jgi:membrane associated rhomboid family serine protease
VTRAPVASRTILVLSCAAWLWQVLDVPWGWMATLALGFTPAWFFAGGPPVPALSWAPFSVNLLTYAFLHAGFLHLAGNMLFLWIFGDDVEDALGQPGFIVLYLLTGALAALAQSLPDPDSTATMIGASGAVSGVLGACLVLRPRATVKLPVPFGARGVLTLSLPVLLLGWFAIQLAMRMAGPSHSGGIALAAHAGGFVAGMALAPVIALVTARRGAMASPRARAG